MESIKTLIVDDEPIAREIMQDYVSRVESLELSGACKNALEAFGLISQKPVDLILLDINMPEISGLEFLKVIKGGGSKVIFTTAYPEYAAESYDLDAVDYLLKPVSFDRFLKAIQKAQDQITKKIESPAQQTVNTSGNLIFVKTEGKLVKIDLREVWFIEGLKDYARFWTDSGRLVVHSTMKKIEEELSAQKTFIRVNKSYIVNFRHVSTIDGNQIQVHDHKIPIGTTYRDSIQDLTKGFRII